MDARPLPAGCEQVPAIGTGIGMHEMINTADPTRPTKGTAWDEKDWSRASLLRPSDKKGMETTNHRIAHFKGRMPSEMCMAKASFGNRVRKPPLESRLTKIFGFFMVD